MINYATLITEFQIYKSIQNYTPSLMRPQKTSPYYERKATYSINLKRCEGV